MDKIEVVRTIGAGMIELGISTVLHALPLNISKVRPPIAFDCHTFWSSLGSGRIFRNRTKSMAVASY